MNNKEKLIDVAKTSKKSTSLRITLPKKVAEKLSIGEEEFVGFYEENGKIVIKKVY